MEASSKENWIRGRVSCGAVKEVRVMCGGILFLVLLWSVLTALGAGWLFWAFLLLMGFWGFLLDRAKKESSDDKAPETAQEPAAGGTRTETEMERPPGGAPEPYKSLGTLARGLEGKSWGSMEELLADLGKTFRVNRVGRRSVTIAKAGGFSDTYLLHLYTYGEGVMCSAVECIFLFDAWDAEHETDAADYGVYVSDEGAGASEESLGDAGETLSASGAEISEPCAASDACGGDTADDDMDGADCDGDDG